MLQNKIRQAAVLMLSLGEDGAAEVMKSLGASDVQKLSREIALITEVSHNEVQHALDEFTNAVSSNSGIGLSKDEYLKDVLVKALGADRALAMMEGIVDMTSITGIEGLRWVDPETTAEMIKDEHPQIIATILAHLEPDQSANIIQNFNPRLRHEVILRVATLEGVKPHAVRDLNEVLTKVVSGHDHLRKQQLGGIRAAAEIMNFLSNDQESEVMEGIKSHDEDLAQRITDEMFVFDDIVNIENNGIQVILKEIQPESLVTAMKLCSEELKQKIFNNLSVRAADMLREDLELRGPVKISEVEAEQKAILTVVRRLAETNQIQIAVKSDEVFV